MESDLIKRESREIYESPEVLYMDIQSQGFLCISADWGSYINDAQQEVENIFEETVTQ